MRRHEQSDYHYQFHLALNVAGDLARKVKTFPQNNHCTRMLWLSVQWYWPELIIVCLWIDVFFKAIENKSRDSAWSPSGSSVVITMASTRKTFETYWTISSARKSINDLFLIGKMLTEILSSKWQCWFNDEVLTGSWDVKSEFQPPDFGLFFLFASLSQKKEGTAQGKT